MAREIVLASGSPRRSQLLRQMGLRFRVEPTDADETLPQGSTPAEAVAELARRKAGVAAERFPDAVIIAADTVVSVGGNILGKPADPADAAAMLRMLSGRRHEVLTGLCVWVAGRAATAVEETRVYFSELDEEEIAGYVATGEPMDKAGAYGIQGRAGVFVHAIEGCYYNVMGLPLSRLKRLLVQALGESEYKALASWRPNQA